MLDAAPSYVVPATVSFIAAEAQFAQGGRNLERARKADVSGQARHRSPGCLETYRDYVRAGLTAWPGPAGRRNGRLISRPDCPLRRFRQPVRAAQCPVTIPACRHPGGRLAPVRAWPRWTTHRSPSPPGRRRIVGPDGVGKSTLLALIAGVKRGREGTVRVLGGDMASTDHRDRAAPRIAYMPQGLGRNLYPTLSAENIDFFGSLFGLGSADRRAQIDRLLRATGLDPSRTARPASCRAG